MKFTYLTAATLGLFLACPALHAIADDQTPPPAMDHHQGHDGWDDGKMKAKLGLTDDQVAKLKAMGEANKNAFKPFMEKERGIIAKLNDQVVNKAPDADIQTTLNDLKANRSAMKEQMEKMQDEKDTILTPTQQAKRILAREKMFKHAHGKHGGMHKGQGPAHPDNAQAPDDSQH
jgi:Spy/CpxP family protein refolding chaperone